MPSENKKSPDELLRRIGSRARHRRGELGLSIKALAERAGMSPRFLSDVEAGRGNIAVGRLDNLADALEMPVVSLLQPTAGSVRSSIDELLAGCSEAELAPLLSVLEAARGKRVRKVIALLGVRGAGKSTVGRALAKQLGLPFVELVAQIEELAGMPLGELFDLHGTGYYRRLEHRCLTDLLTSGRACVAALPGGIVSRPDAFQLVRETCHSVWLRAEPQDYWERVHAQGDTRPMAGREDAEAELQALIAQRNPLYRQAEHVVETSGIEPDAVVTTLLTKLDNTFPRS